MTLDEQVCFSLYSATNAMVRAYRPLLAALDLTYPQYLVMLALWERDHIGVNQLSERTRLDAGTLTPLLKRLEGKGLLERRRSTEDERARVLVLTTAGRALRRKAETVPGQLLCRVQMSAAELKTLKTLGEHLWERLR